MKVGFRKKIIVSLALIFLFAIKAFAFDYFVAGKKAFYSKDYKNAKMYFEYALKDNPNNVNYRYYYAQSLIYLYKLDDAQKEYERIIEISPSSNAAKLSFKGIANINSYLLKQRTYNLQGYSLKLSLKDKIKGELLQGIGDNYIDIVPDNGNIIRWTLDKQLRLYFDGSTIPGFQPEYIDAVKEAFDTWLVHLNGRLTYEIVEDSKKADIVVLFMPIISVQTDKEGNSGFISGLATPHPENNILKFVDIKFATMKPNQKPFTRTEIFDTALHEAGHALGIMGHSSNEKDIMYPIADSKKKQLMLSLSPRDIDTLKLLYRLDPDISNFDSGKIPVAKSGKNSAVLGDQTSILENKLQEAKEYTKKVPDHPISWTSLGTAYYNMKKYDEAMANYKKAILINPKYAPAIEGAANVYRDKGDYKNAINSYQTLVNLNGASIAYSYNLAVLYLKDGNKQDAQNTINVLISKNSKAKDDKNIKRLQQQFIKQN